MIGARDYFVLDKLGGIMGNTIRPKKPSTIETVTFWYRSGKFRDDKEARGAFTLAYLQALDGMGDSIQEWMGMTRREFDAWMGDDELPNRSVANLPAANVE